jgi:hypothetical protein
MRLNHAELNQQLKVKSPSRDSLFFRACLSFIPKTIAIAVIVSECVRVYVKKSGGERLLLNVVEKVSHNFARRLLCRYRRQVLQNNNFASRQCNLLNSTRSPSE